MKTKTLETHPAAVSFKLCEAMGAVGKSIWKVGLQLKTMDERVEYLRDAIAYVREKAQQGKYWRQVPVDFRTFCCSEDYLNRPDGLWPEVLRCGNEMNSGKYIEAVLTGGIGVGKSHLAIYSQAYQLYVLTCMAEPHKTFDLDAASNIVIIFQSLSMGLAKDVDYSAFRSLIDEAPYFKTHATYDRDRASEMRFDMHKIVVKPVAGHDTAAIGQNVIGGILDEVNFGAVVENSKNSKDGGTYDQMLANYHSIARRRESRFMQLGDLPGLLCLVSSRNYPGQFTDKKEEEARQQIAKTGRSRIYIYDKRAWEVRPWLFCGERFRVFIGDETRKPRILDEDEIVPVDDEPLVMGIPIEYRNQFEIDLLPALRDIAGVATQALHPFMLNTSAVAACFGTVQSIASRDDCDFLVTKVQLYPKRVEHPDEPRFAHVDLALSKDSAGVSVGHIVGFKDVNRGDHIETLPVIQFDMILEIRPPRGGEIELENVRRLLYAIRDKLKLPLKYVTFDQFQSRDSMQIMMREGFTVGYRSMDIDTFAYEVTKQAFYDGRILAPKHPKAQHEMVTLELDTKKNKIDHSPHGSKDVSDSMAGVVVGLTLLRSLWHRHKVPLRKMPSSIADAKAQTTKDDINRRDERNAA